MISETRGAVGAPLHSQPLNARSRVALVVLLAAVYAVCYSAIKLGLEYAQPLSFAGLRALVGGGALLVLLLILRLPLLAPRRFLPGILCLAAASTLLGYAAMFLSPGRTGAGIASVLGNSGPLMVVGLATVFLHERLTAAKLVAMVLGFIGVSLIASPAIADPSPSGIWAAATPLGAAFGFAAGSVIVKRMNVAGAFLQIAAWQLVIGGACLLLLATLFEGGVAAVWTGRFVALFSFLALVGTAFATAMWYWLIPQDDVGRLSLMLFLVPILGLGMAVVLFEEGIGLLEGFGVVVTISGLTVLAKDSRSEKHS